MVYTKYFSVVRVEHVKYKWRRCCKYIIIIPLLSKSHMCHSNEGNLPLLAARGRNINSQILFRSRIVCNYTIWKQPMMSAKYRFSPKYDTFIGQAYFFKLFSKNLLNL